MQICQASKLSVTKTIRVEQASQEHDLTQPFPGSCNLATPLVVSIPINAVAVTSWECHYIRLPSLSVFLFPYMYCVVRVHVPTCIYMAFRVDRCD